MAFGIECHDSLVDGFGEVFGTSEGLMGEIMPLQVAPHPFDLIELRGVFREPLQIASMPRCNAAIRWLIPKRLLSREIKEFSG